MDATEFEYWRPIASVGYMAFMAAFTLLNPLFRLSRNEPGDWDELSPLLVIGLIFCVLFVAVLYVLLPIVGIAWTLVSSMLGIVAGTCLAYECYASERKRDEWRAAIEARKSKSRVNACGP